MTAARNCGEVARTVADVRAVDLSEELPFGPLENGQREEAQGANKSGERAVDGIGLVNAFEQQALTFLFGVRLFAALASDFEQVIA